MVNRISSIHIKPAENGGFSVEHHFSAPVRAGKFGMQYSVKPPETHSFGPDEGHDMLAHVADHLGVEAPEESK